MQKMCVGIPVMNIINGIELHNGAIWDYEYDDEYQNVWCDFEVTFYPDVNVYTLSFETMLGFDTEDGARNHIKHCLDVFTEYMLAHNLDTTQEINMYEFFTEGINVNTHFESLEKAYAFVKLAVNGFNGQGLGA